MPIPIKFEQKRVTSSPDDAQHAKPEEIEVDNIINNPNPAWTKQPSELSEEDYKSFFTTNCIQCN
jgi:molecular chaperone HtpG